MALIPPLYFNCVVTLGTRKPGCEVSWCGTGTLVGRHFRRQADRSSQYHVFIVTNKHVLENQREMVVRFNPLDSQPAQNFDIPLYNHEGDALWKGHPNRNIDLAAIGINSDFLRQEGIQYDFFQSDNHLMPLDEMARSGISEGDFIYVLGFPMGIGAPNRQYVIARSGIIARLRDTLENNSKDFLVDAMVFPGNSGGPVIYKPEIISIEGTRSVTKPGLIGIVTSYLTYSEAALSQQTGQPRIVFEENSGLAVVIPVDYVIETLDVAFTACRIKERDLVDGTVPEFA
ncbi:MAG: hypothetical protein COV67_15345 [Nitrospinae bacterium CG11_big_fil_rev_8_21_14_0_20_56_8]|nr:MAG: hypothetical protein COV67_15345 [Nitrospinae bacterium CG11_big_fil_rev_8_21_14_0_20_56_8]